MPTRLNLLSASPFGPIFAKELRVTSRRKRSYFLRFFYLALLLLCLVFVWSISGISTGGSVAYRQQRQAELGEMFFATFAIFCVGAMGLIGPVLTATAVNSERLHRTLHVLLMTPINSWQIVGGKLFSRMLIALTLIGLSLPVLALTRLLGGVEIEQVIGVICLAAVTALTGASIGLLFSTIMRRGYAVILMSYALMGFIYLFVPMMLVLADLGMRSRTLEFGIAAFNPFVCTAMLVGNVIGRGPAWESCALAHVAFSSVLVLITALALRRASRKEDQGPAAAIAVADVDSAPKLMPTGAGRHRQSVSNNPVLWRELRRPLMNRRWQRIVGSIACIVLLLITYGVLASENDLLDSETHIGYAFVFNSLTMLLACVLSATAIAQEKETDTWTLLLATPMSARQIMLGKVLGAMRKMLWPTLLPAAHFIIFAWAGAVSWYMAALTLWVMITFNVLWIATGVFLSLLLRRVTFAVIVNLMLPIIAYAVMPIALLIAGELIAGSDDWAEVVVLYLPYYYFVELIERPEYTYLATYGQTDTYTFAMVTIVAGFAHLLVSGAILRLTIGRFDRIVGRSATC